MGQDRAKIEQYSLTMADQHVVENDRAFACTLVAGGEGILRAGGMQRAFTGGDVFLHPPGLRVTYGGQAYGEAEVYILFLPAEQLPALLPDAQSAAFVGDMLARTRSLRGVAVARQVFPQLLLGAEWVAEAQKDVRAYSARIGAGLWSALLLTLAREDTLSPEEMGRKTGMGPVETARQIVRLRYDEPLTLAAVAAELNLSAPYLSGLFTEKCDSSFSAYLQQVRLENAITRLLDSDDLITQIAEECGFGSSAYFGYVFKKTMGVSPLQYRKQSRQANRQGT